MVDLRPATIQVWFWRPPSKVLVAVLVASCSVNRKKNEPARAFFSNFERYFFCHVSMKFLSNPRFHNSKRLRRAVTCLVMSRLNFNYFHQARGKMHSKQRGLFVTSHQTKPNQTMPAKKPIELLGVCPSCTCEEGHACRTKCPPAPQQGRKTLPAPCVEKIDSY